MECARPSGLNDGLVEISEPGKGKEPLGYIVLNPGSGAQGGVWVALEIALLDSLRVANHLPAVAGQIGTVDDKRSHRSTPRGFFILICPSAVVGERLALEELLVVRGRLVDDDKCD